jgi:hypothetical protein
MNAINNMQVSSRRRSWRAAAAALLGVLILLPSAQAQTPGFASDDWIGTLPNIHVGPQDVARSAAHQGPSTFYIEGPWRQVLGAAMQAGGSYVSVQGLPNGELRATFHGDQFLSFDMELFESAGVRCGMRTESGAGVVALEVNGRMLRSQPLIGDLGLPVDRLHRAGVLESGVVLHSYDPVAGRGRTAMRVLNGRLYLFQTS